MKLSTIEVLISFFNVKKGTSLLIYFEDVLSAFYIL